MATEQPTNQDGTNVLVPDKGEAEKVSKPDVETSTKQTQETENKAYRTLQSAIDKANAKIATLEKEKQSKSKNEAIEDTVKSLLEDDGEEISDVKQRKVKDFVREYVAKDKETTQKAEELDTRVQEFETKYSDTVNSKYLYDKAFPEASDVIRESLAKMADAKTDRERELLAEKLSVGLREQLIEALTKEEKEVKRPDSGRTSTSGGKKGKIPTLEELRASSPADTEKKVKSGEWTLPGWVS